MTDQAARPHPTPNPKPAAARPPKRRRWWLCTAGCAALLVAAAITTSFVTTRRWESPPIPHRPPRLHAAALPAPSGGTCRLRVERPAVWTGEDAAHYAVRVHNPCSAAAFGITLHLAPRGASTNVATDTDWTKLAALAPHTTTMLTDRFMPRSDSDRTRATAATARAEVLAWRAASLLHHPTAPWRTLCQLLTAGITATAATTGHPGGGRINVHIRVHADHWPANTVQQFVVATVNARGAVLTALSATSAPGVNRPWVIDWPAGADHVIAYWQPPATPPT